MAGAPTVTDFPVKFAVASGLKTASSRSNCRRSMATGKRPRVCWIPVMSPGDGLLIWAYSEDERPVHWYAVSAMQTSQVVGVIRMVTEFCEMG